MPAKTHRVTVTDVARAAGVSEQTVSRTVHDSPAVRAETKERVRRAMRELGYRPNFAGQSLRRGRYRTLGVVMFDITATGNLDRLDGFTRAAEKNGYAITLLRAPENPTLTAAAQQMSALPVDGMIFCLNRMVEDFYDFRPPFDLPTVIITMKEHPTLSTGDNDHHRCSHDVVDYFLARGHRTVHHIAGPLRSLSGMQREEGWRRALAERGIEPPAVLRGDWSPASGYEAGVRLASDPEVTAVYASNDAMAYGCIRALEAHGRQVPDDVSVIGVDDVLSTVVPDASLTSVRFDNRQVGLWAVEKIIDDSPDGAKREHRLFRGHIIERESVRTLI